MHFAGKIATEFLLQGTKRLRSGPKNERRFKKPGTLVTAISDFYSVDPRDIRTFRGTNGVRHLLKTVFEREDFNSYTRPSYVHCPVKETMVNRAFCACSKALFRLARLNFLCYFF